MLEQNESSSTSSETSSSRSLPTTMKLDRLGLLTNQREGLECVIGTETTVSSPSHLRCPLDQVPEPTTPPFSTDQTVAKEGVWHRWNIPRFIPADDTDSSQNRGSMRTSRPSSGPAPVRDAVGPSKDPVQGQSRSGCPWLQSSSRCDDRQPPCKGVQVKLTGEERQVFPPRIEPLQFSPRREQLEHFSPRSERRQSTPRNEQLLFLPRQRQLQLHDEKQPSPTPHPRRRRRLNQPQRQPPLSPQQQQQEEHVLPNTANELAQTRTTPRGDTEPVSLHLQCMQFMPTAANFISLNEHVIAERLKMAANEGEAIEAVNSNCNGVTEGSATPTEEAESWSRTPLPRSATPLLEEFTWGAEFESDDPAAVEDQGEGELGCGELTNRWLLTQDEGRRVRGNALLLPVRKPENCGYGFCAMAIDAAINSVSMDDINNSDQRGSGQRGTHPSYKKISRDFSQNDACQDYSPRQRDPCQHGQRQYDLCQHVDIYDDDDGNDDDEDVNCDTSSISTNASSLRCKTSHIFSARDFGTLPPLAIDHDDDAYEQLSNATMSLTAPRIVVQNELSLIIGDNVSVTPGLVESEAGCLNSSLSAKTATELVAYSAVPPSGLPKTTNGNVLTISVVSTEHDPNDLSETINDTTSTIAINPTLTYNQLDSSQKSADNDELEKIPTATPESPVKESVDVNEAADFLLNKSSNAKTESDPTPLSSQIMLLGRTKSRRTFSDEDSSDSDLIKICNVGRPIVARDRKNSRVHGAKFDRNNSARGTLSDRNNSARTHWNRLPRSDGARFGGSKNASPQCSPERMQRGYDPRCYFPRRSGGDATGRHNCNRHRLSHSGPPLRGYYVRRSYSPRRDVYASDPRRAFDGPGAMCHCCKRPAGEHVCRTSSTSSGNCISCRCCCQQKPVKGGDGGKNSFVWKFLCVMLLILLVCVIVGAVLSRFWFERAHSDSHSDSCHWFADTSSC